MKYVTWCFYCTCIVCAITLMCQIHLLNKSVASLRTTILYQTESQEKFIKNATEELIKSRKKIGDMGQSGQINP